ncbi:MAG TPA: sigma-E factor negative regulatory protein [Sulfuricaulis sp.]
MSNTEDNREKLSALVDNELNDLDERRVLTALEQDVELRNTWERYHLVRSVLRQDMDTVLSPEIAKRVSASIEKDPVSAISFPRQKVIQLIGTFAIAASVAAIAIAGVQFLNRPHSGPVASLAVNEPAPENIIRAGTTRWDRKEPETESALNNFLVEHNEFASSSGIGGMMPYVRVVGYDNPK